MIPKRKDYWGWMEKLANQRKELSEAEKAELRRMRSDKSKRKIEKGLMRIAKKNPERLRALGYSDEQIDELQNRVK